jgi:hypothetical protein
MDLSGLPQHVVGRHQVLDIPPIRPLVREVVRYGRYCPACNTYQRAEIPAGYERRRVVGPHLEGLVLYLHYAHPLRYQQVQRILEEMCGLKLGIGTLVNVVKRGQSVLKHGAAAIRVHLQQAAVVGADETGARVKGQNYCQWVFQTPQWVYYVIRPSKAAQELHTVMGDAQPQVWVSDAGSSQMKHPTQHYQVCLAHRVRKLQYPSTASAARGPLNSRPCFYERCDWQNTALPCRRNATRFRCKPPIIGWINCSSSIRPAKRARLCGATFTNREPLYWCS